MIYQITTPNCLNSNHSQFNSLGKISDIIYLGKSFFGRFSSEYNSGQIYIARNFFLQSNTRVCRSKLPSGWRPRVIFLLQTLVCEDCSKKFPAICLSLGILYMKIFKTNFKKRTSVLTKLLKFKN
jgi:hypothetical protein